MKLGVKIAAITFLAGLALIAAAQTPYTLIQPLPGVGDQAPIQQTTFPEYVQRLVPLLISIAAVLAVLTIIWNGLKYGVSEAVESKGNAKGRITEAIYGLLLALVAWLILYTINPDLVNLRLTIPGLP